MNKHGNAPEMTPGQFAEFVSAVVSNLPRDLSSREAQKWINDRHALSLVLREALVSMDTYTLKVYYGQSVEEALATGNYDWTSEYLTSRNFLPTRQGTNTLELHLVHFGLRMTSDEVLEEFNKQGLRPATVEELLALGARHSDLQRKFPIVALGSVYVYSDGLSGVPVLWSWSLDRGRDAYLDWLGSIWGSNFRFAAVSK